MDTGRTYQAMIEGLQEEEWKFVELGNAPAVLLTVETCHGYFTCYGEADDDREQVVFYTRYGVKAPKHRRAEVGEYLARANWNLTIGNFDYDYDTGTARFRTAFGGGPITSRVIRALVLPNLETADIYLPGFLAVSAGVMSARDAVEHLELYPLADVLAAASEQLG